MFDSYTDLQLDDNFGKVTCEPTWKWDTSRHPLEDFDLWYAWGGEGRMELNGRPYTVGKGTCFLFRPGDGTLAGHNPLQPLTVTFLHFQFAVPAAVPLQPHTIVRDTFLFETYLNRYVETMLDQRGDYMKEAKLLLSLMLIQLQREQESHTDSFLTGTERESLVSLIRTIAYRVRQHPGAVHSLYSMAESAGLSPRYFSIKFKAIMGLTVEQYIIRTKMERAEHLLRYNGMNVSEVSEALGYKDVSFFSRQFSQTRGFPPSKLKYKKSDDL